MTATIVTPALEMRKTRLRMSTSTSRRARATTSPRPVACEIQLPHPELGEGSGMGRAEVDQDPDTFCIFDTFDHDASSTTVDVASASVGEEREDAPRSEGSRSTWISTLSREAQAGWREKNDIMA